MTELESLKHEYRTLKSSLDSLGERIEAITEEKTAFEIGKWYADVNDPSSILCFGPTESDVFGFWKGTWNTGYDFFNIGNVQPCRLATESEIKESLQKESDKRGYKHGVTVKRQWYDNAGLEVRRLSSGGYYYDVDIDTLSLGGREVYKAGVWSEIIKDEAITIGGYTAAYSNCGTMGWVKFGCKDYSKDQVYKLLHTLKSVKAECVQIEGYEVTILQLEKVLKGFHSL